MKPLKWIVWFPIFLFGSEHKSVLNLTMVQADRVAAKIVIQMLNTLGQRLGFQRFEREGGNLYISLSMVGNRVFEPKVFEELLGNNGLSVISGSVKNNQWKMHLDATPAKWNIPVITLDEGAQIEKGSSTSWFMIDQSKAISIEAPYSGKWYPDVAVLDANMEVLSSLREFKPYEKLSFSLPERAMYMKVSSANGMKLLKEGMWIEHATE